MFLPHLIDKSNEPHDFGDLFDYKYEQHKRVIVTTADVYKLPPSNVELSRPEVMLDVSEVMPDTPKVVPEVALTAESHMGWDHPQFKVESDPLRFLTPTTPYRGLLLYHGHGKRKLASSMAESFKRVLVLTPSPDLFREVLTKEQQDKFIVSTYEDATELDDACVIVEDVHTFVNHPKYDELLHADCRVIALSRTPVVNEVFDLAKVLNLVRGKRTTYEVASVSLSEDEIRKTLPDADTIHIEDITTLTQAPRGFMHTKDHKLQYVGANHVSFENRVSMLFGVPPVLVESYALPTTKDEFHDQFVKDKHDFASHIRGLVSFAPPLPVTTHVHKCTMSEDQLVQHTEARSVDNETMLRVCNSVYPKRTADGLGADYVDDLEEYSPKYHAMCKFIQAHLDQSHVVYTREPEVLSVVFEGKGFHKDSEPRYMVLEAKPWDQSGVCIVTTPHIHVKGDHVHILEWSEMDKLVGRACHKNTQVHKYVMVGDPLNETADEVAHKHSPLVASFLKQLVDASIGATVQCTIPLQGFELTYEKQETWPPYVAMHCQGKHVGYVSCKFNKLGKKVYVFYDVEKQKLPTQAKVVAYLKSIVVDK